MDKELVINRMARELRKLKSQVCKISDNLDESGQGQSSLVDGIEENKSSIESLEAIPSVKSIDSLVLSGNTVTLSFTDKDELQSSVNVDLFTLQEAEIQNNVLNFSELANITNPDLYEFAYVRESEGTQWLPAGLGGTYYGAGLYMWNGTEWVEDDTDVFNQLQLLINNLNLEIQERITNDNLKLDKFQTVYYIKDVNDFLDIHPANGANEIDLGNNVYVIDSPSLDLGVYTLKSSVDTALHGISQSINELVCSTDNSYIIESTGNLFLYQLSLRAEGVNSKAIELNGATGNESLDMKYVEFRGDTKYGSLTNIRQGYWSDGFSLNSKQGFDLNGTILGGFTLINSRIINTGDYILKGNTGCTLNNVRSNVNATIPLGAVGFDFDFSMFNTDEGYSLVGGQYSGSGQVCSQFTTGDYLDAEKSRKSNFSNNKGNLAVNTRKGGGWRIITETVTPITFNTPVKLEGITLYDNLEHITSSGNNALTSNSTITSVYNVDGYITLSGGANDIIELQIRKFDNISSTYTTLESFVGAINNFSGNADSVQFIPRVARVTMSELDRIELFVVNTTDDTDVTLLIDSFLYMTEIK